VRALLHFVIRETQPTRTRASWWDLSEIGLVGLGFLLYFLVRGAVVDRTGEALRNARMVIDFQSSLGVWIEPSVQSLMLQAQPLMRAMNFVYFWFDFPLIILVGLILFWRSRRNYTVLRDALLISGGIALIVYWTFPVAPPRYMTEWGFIDTLEHFDNLSYQAQSMKPFVNPFAAVPSLHVGWAMLLALALFRASERWIIRIAGISVLVLQTVAVIATGNHYLTDACVGLLVCAIAWAAAKWLEAEGYPRLRASLMGAERHMAGIEAGD
jgi:hypothetical protein